MDSKGAGNRVTGNVVLPRSVVFPPPNTSAKRYESQGSKATMTLQYLDIHGNLKAPFSIEHSGREAFEIGSVNSDNNLDGTYNEIDDKEDMDGNLSSWQTANYFDRGVLLSDSYYADRIYSRGAGGGNIDVYTWYVPPRDESNQNAIYDSVSISSDPGVLKTQVNGTFNLRSNSLKPYPIDDPAFGGQNYYDLKADVTPKATQQVAGTVSYQDLISGDDLGYTQQYDYTYITPLSPLKGGQRRFKPAIVNQEPVWNADMDITIGVIDEVMAAFRSTSGASVWLAGQTATFGNNEMVTITRPAREIGFTPGLFSPGALPPL